MSRKLSLGSYEQVERMGRPAINTVFNHTDAEKEAANRLRPSDDRAFDLDNVVGVLDAIDNVLDVERAPVLLRAAPESMASPRCSCRTPSP